jgi:hypothetical protein
MKKKLYILTLGLLILLLSCGSRDEKKNVAGAKKDTFQTKFELKEKKRLEKIKKDKEEEKIDSLRLDKVLIDALKIATQNISKNKFQKEYEVTLDNAYNVEVEINLNNHFTENYQHLIIRRHSPGSVNIDIYSNSKGNIAFKKVLSHEEWSMTYVNDTIQDINGDGLKDFVVNWYGSNGCCLKAFSNIYLLRADKKTFSNTFEFINPTFSPKEKIIRGVCYGHPSDTEMYKYKWNGETIDTLEYISYEKNKKGEKTGKIIISNKKPYGNPFKILKRLNSIPDEYKKIEGFDWFTGKGYK